MSRELEAVALWRDGGGGLWMGRSGPERPWNWLTGTAASPDDLLCLCSMVLRPVERLVFSPKER